jgi:hypothetical protein
MVLRIERSRLQGLTISAVSGNLDKNYTPELEWLSGPSSDYSTVIVGLSDVNWQIIKSLRTSPEA